MELEKAEQLLEQLEEQFAKLQALQQKQPDVLTYLSNADKEVILTAKEKRRKDRAKARGKKKGERLCNKMVKNWKKRIVGPLMEEIETLLSDPPSNPGFAIGNIMQKYFDKYKDKNWFDPNNERMSPNFPDYFKFGPVERNIDFQRQGQPGGPNGYTFFPSNYNGEILSSSTREPLNLGKDTIVRVGIPQDQEDILRRQSNGSVSQFVGGKLTFSLNSVDVPDRIVVTSNGAPILSQNINGGLVTGSAGFNKIGRTVDINVIESQNLSIWTANVTLTFLKISILVPDCNPSHPCFYNK